MKKYHCFFAFAIGLVACNVLDAKNNSNTIDSKLLSGKIFYNADTNANLVGLDFQNDSLVQALYKVCFDTVFIWRYKVVNSSLYRYERATNKLEAKDSILTLTDSLLELQSFTPDTDKKLILNQNLKINNFFNSQRAINLR